MDILILRIAWLLQKTWIVANRPRIKEAVNSKEAKNWISAMKEELDSLKRNETCLL